MTRYAIIQKEEEWLTSHHPRKLLFHLTHEEVSYGMLGVDDAPRDVRLITDRKLRLFCCACCMLKHGRIIGGYHHWSLDGEEEPDEDHDLPFVDAEAWVKCRTHDVPSSALADLIREIVGNPFRRLMDVKWEWTGRTRAATDIYYDPAWFTVDVKSMARNAYESLDFTGLPALADALEEVGCPQVHPHFADGRAHPLLEHLRAGAAHVRGCWVLDLIMGKE